MPRSSITETVQRVQSLVDQVRALSPDEQGFFFDLLMPEPEQPVMKVKRGRKKKTTTTAATTTKKRGLPTDAPLLSAVPAKDEEDSGPRCHICGHGEMYQDHFKPSPHYHEFKTAA